MFSGAEPSRLVNIPDIVVFNRNSQANVASQLQELLHYDVVLNRLFLFQFNLFLFLFLLHLLFLVLVNELAFDLFLAVLFKLVRDADVNVI